jgi:LysR family glycine cleavage system transcriptional activator
VLQAAMEGQGVALARSIMAHDDLASGRLVRLFPECALPSALAYYVVYPPECAELPKLLAFKEWLFDEAAVTTAACHEDLRQPFRQRFRPSESACRLPPGCHRTLR